MQEATYTYKAPQAKPITVKFMPPTTWDEVYLYAWDTNGSPVLGGWPGMEWKTKDTEGWLFYTFDSKYREINIIFTNNAGEQSNDIILDEDACYEWKDGAEALSDLCSTDIPFQLIVSPEGKVFKTDSLEITITTVGEQGIPAIYYTLDSTDPKESSTRSTYTAPIVITQATTLKAYAQDGVIETEVQTHVYTYEMPQTTPLTITFRKPDEWKKVNLYTWNEGGSIKYTGDWPGSEMTNTNEKGWYYHQFDASVKEVNFIFNDGTTQSADLWTDEDVCYGCENKKAVIIDCTGTTTDVENVENENIPLLDVTRPMYNILGQQVNATYQGLIIQNGHKYLQ